jgi:hypothetical protein
LNHIPFSISHSPYSPDCTHMHILWHPRDRHTYSHILHTRIARKERMPIYTYSHNLQILIHVFSHPTHQIVRMCIYFYTLQIDTRILTAYIPDSRKERMPISTYIHIFAQPTNTYIRILTPCTPACTYMQRLWHPRNVHAYSDSLHTGFT